MTAQPPPPSRQPGVDSFERNLQRIRLRQDTEENWLKNDPTPASGELCYSIGQGDPGRMLKCGDGIAPWSNLPYLAGRGDSGPPGPPGLDGDGITVYGPSENPPSPANNPIREGDVWLSDGIYAKNPHFDMNLIQPGAKGDAGEIVAVEAQSLLPGSPASVLNRGTTTDADLIFGIPVGDVGPQGIMGPHGPVGPQGPAGDTFTVSGAVADDSALPATPQNLAVYITQDNSHLNIYDPTSAAAGANGYVDLGAIAGPTGAAAFITNPVASASALPTPGAAGQAVLALDTGNLHSWDDLTQTWTDAGKIIGPEGKSVPAGLADGEVGVWSIADNDYVPTLYKLHNITDVSAKTQKDGSPLEDCDIIHYELSTKTWVAKSIRDFVNNQVNLDNLGDCTIVGGATPDNGQVLTWDKLNKVWLNKTIPSINKLSDIADVDLAIGDGEVLAWDANSSKWHSVLPSLVTATGDFMSDGSVPMTGSIDMATFPIRNLGDPTQPGDAATKIYVDSRFSVLVTGLSHNAPVEAIINDPPTGNHIGEYYIVGQSPTGAWVGHTNDIAFHDSLQSGGWAFYPPTSGEARLVENTGSIFTYNGFSWVRISSSVTGSTAARGVGEIIPWVSSSVPSEYLPCDGRIVAMASFPDLHSVIGNQYNSGTLADGTTTFALPDFRGYFLRGIAADDTVDKDGVRAVGSIQEDSTAQSKNTINIKEDGDHSHTIKTASYTYSNTHTAGSYPSGGGSYQQPYAGADAPIVNDGSHHHPITGFDEETRPKNVAVNWVIRVYPINGGATGSVGPQGLPGVNGTDGADGVDGPAKLHSYDAARNYDTDEVVEIERDIFTAAQPVVGVSPTAETTDANWRFLGRLQAGSVSTIVTNGSEAVVSLTSRPRHRWKLNATIETRGTPTTYHVPQLIGVSGSSWLDLSQTTCGNLWSFWADNPQASNAHISYHSQAEYLANFAVGTAGASLLPNAVQYQVRGQTNFKINIEGHQMASPNHVGNWWAIRWEISGSFWGNETGLAAGQYRGKGGEWDDLTKIGIKMSGSDNDIYLSCDYD